MRAHNPSHERWHRAPSHRCLALRRRETAVRELVQHALLIHALRQRFLGPFALRDVTGNLGGANDGASGIHDRRNAQ